MLILSNYILKQSSIVFAWPENVKESEGPQL